METSLTTAGRVARDPSESQKLVLAGLWVLKKMDVKKEDGGQEFSAPLPSDLAYLDDVLFDLKLRGYANIDAKKGRWVITPAGLTYLGMVIDEANELVEEFEDAEVEDVVEALIQRKRDLLRARFLWGWVEGEFDDLTLFQEQRGLDPVEQVWPIYLLSDEFYSEISKDLRP